MVVKRIVANIATEKIDLAKRFYEDILELKIVMDLDWVVTFSNESSTAAQISFATNGGSGTPVPDLSIEVDNLDEIYQRCVANHFPIEYGPVDEHWGVRRFYTRDPFNRLINILSHISPN